MTGPNAPSRSPLGGFVLLLVIAVLAIFLLILAFRAGRRANVEEQIRSSPSAAPGAARTHPYVVFGSQAKDLL